VKAYQLYQQTDSAVIRDMFANFRDEERDIYKTTLATLAQSRKLRPVFLQKKPVPDQISWMHESLGLRPNDSVGEHLFQVWFMRFHKPMLVEFCDGMDIEHNGEGSVEGALPAQIDAGRLKSTTDALFEKYDPRIVFLYLHVFNLQTPGGWPELTALLDSDPRLQAAAPPASPAEEPAPDTEPPPADPASPPGEQELAPAQTTAPDPATPTPNTEHTPPDPS